MKCPYCGEEVKPGTLFCPKCLTEVPWVSEYNTVETLITQKKHEEEKKVCQERKKEQMQKEIRQKKRRLFFLCGFAVVSILGTILLGVGYYRMNSYAYQYQAGVKAYNQEDYDQAMDHMDQALSMEPDNPNANLMMAKIFDAQEDYASVEKILTVFLKEHPDNLEAYGVLLSAMEKNQDVEAIRELLQMCTNPDVLEEYSEYICPDLNTDFQSGTYHKKPMKVEISGECERIYYTLDGTIPDEDSKIYTGPIKLKEGVTVLYAYGVNKKGIPGDIIYRKYVLEPED